MASLNFHLATLGRVCLYDASHQVVAKSGKHLVLLAYLARVAPKPVRREYLATLLWGERNEARARHSLRQALLRLKQDVGDCVHISADDVSVTSVHLDITAFEADVEAGRLEDAVDRWRGEFLIEQEDVGSEDYRAWLDAERAGLRRRLFWALSQLIERATRSESHDRALHYARVWTELAPTDEEAARVRILLLARCDRTLQALALHNTFCERLAQLGIEPSANFIELRHELQQSMRKAELAPQAVVRPPALIGRGAQLAALESIWSRISEQGSVVVIEGERGIGKTRLLHEFVRRRRKTSGTVILETSAQNGDVESLSTAHRLFSELRYASGLAGASDRALGELSRIVPTLHERFRQLPTGKQENGALASALHEVIDVVTAEAPVLICVDDVAHADVATQQLLRDLAGRMPIGTMLVLSAQHGWVDRTMQVTAARQIKLQPLERGQIVEMVASMVDIDSPACEELGAELEVETGGNPFLIAALVSSFADTNRLSPDSNGRWRLKENVRHGDGLPLRAREAVRARVAEVSADARALLDALAVLPEPVEAAILERVATALEIDSKKTLTDLLAAGLVAPDNGGFRHTNRLIRRGVSELVSASLKARILSAAKQRHKWRRARTLALGLLVLAASTSVALTLRNRPATALVGSSQRLTVVAFRNETGRADLDVVGRIAADWLTQGVAKAALLKVTPPLLSLSAENARDGLTLDRPAGVRAIAAETEADLIIWGSYLRGGDSLRFQVRITDARSGRVVHALSPVQAAIANPIPGVDALLQKTLGALGPLIDSRLAGSATVQGAPPSYEAYQEFAQGLSYVYIRSNEGLKHFTRAYQLDTTWVLPLLWVMSHHLGSVRYQLADSIAQNALQPRRAELTPYERAMLDGMIARVRGDGPAYYAAARAGAEIAPNSTIAAVDLPNAAIGLNLPGEALDVMTRSNPDNSDARDLPSRWLMLSSALHMLGKYEQQLEIAKELERRLPFETRAVFYQGRALAALGRMQELDVVLQKGLTLPTNPEWGPHGMRMFVAISDELLAHGHPEKAREVLERAVRFYQKAPADVSRIPKFRFDFAQALYRLGRLPEARKMFEDLLAHGRVMGVNEMILRAHIAYVAVGQADMRTVREMDEWLRTDPEPYLFGINTQHRAAIQALLGNREEAVRLLHQAIAEGSGYSSSTHQVFELNSLLGYPPFGEWLRPKG